MSTGPSLVGAILATGDGEPARCDLAETVGGARRWRRGPRESVAEFAMRVLNEAPCPSDTFSTYPVAA